MKSFDSIGEFVAYLRTLAATAEFTMQKGLHHAGQLVQAESRASIGHYQDAAGPFQRWEPLRDATLYGGVNEVGYHYPGKEELGFSPPDNPLKRTEQLKQAISLNVEPKLAMVGVPNRQAGDGSVYDKDRNLGDVACWMEFGTERMEARSFLGRALFVKEKKVVSIIAHAAAAAVAGMVYEPPHDEPE